MSTQRLPPVPGTTHPGWRCAKPELTSQKRPEATNVLTEPRLTRHVAEALRRPLRGSEGAPSTVVGTRVQSAVMALAPGSPDGSRPQRSSPKPPLPGDRLGVLERARTIPTPSTIEESGLIKIPDYFRPACSPHRRVRFPTGLPREGPIACHGAGHAVTPGWAPLPPSQPCLHRVPRTPAGPEPLTRSTG